MAAAVAEAARADGVARREWSEPAAEVDAVMWDPEYAQIVVE